MHSVHMKPNPLDPGEFGVHTEDSAEAEGKSSLSVEGKTHKIIISYPHSTCLAGKEDSSSWNNKKKKPKSSFLPLLNVPCRGQPGTKESPDLESERPEFESFLWCLLVILP